MMKSLFLLFLISELNGFSQTIEVLQNKIPKELSAKLQGVKYAIVPLSNDEYDAYKRSQINLQQMDAIGRFVRTRLKINDFTYAPDQRDFILDKLNSFCEVVSIAFDPGNFVSSLGAVGTYRNATFSFAFCDNSIYVIKLNPISVSGLTNWPSKLYSTLSNISFPKMEYSKSNQIVLAKGDSIISKEELEKYLPTKKYYYEGVYKSIGISGSSEIGIVNINGVIKVVYLGGGYREDWFVGENKGILRETKSEKTFFADWIGGGKMLTEGVLLVFDNDNNKFTISRGEQKEIYIRLL